MSDFEPTPGMHDDIAEEVYHSHRDSLSSTGAKSLLKSPKRFHWERNNVAFKKVFEFGSAAHQKVLGSGPEIRAIPDDLLASNGAASTKGAKEFIAAARAEGAIPLKSAEVKQIDDMATELATHRLASELLSVGRPEVSAYALDEATGVLRRGRFDWLHPSLLVDYKSVASSHPTAISGRYGVIAKLGYHLQAAWYTDLARDCGHPGDGFAFIFQQKEAPYEVTVAFIEEDDLAAARALNRQALEIFRDCTESGIWPGAVPDTTAARVSIEMPTYTEEKIL